MRIAIIGSAGQLGSDLCLRLPKAFQLTREQIDITVPESIDAALKGLEIDLVINTAAYNLVDRAEDEPENAFAVNAFGARNLGLWCGRNQLTLLHVSTDHVFGSTGSEEPLHVQNAGPPDSAYGASKLTGEYFVEAECPQHYIVRTCGLYGAAATRAKGNFVNTMLRLGTERDELKVVNDQICTPTSTEDLSEGIARLIETQQFGTYHITNSGETSWYGFAAEIFRLAKIDVSLIPITSREFNAKARRPGYSVLNCMKFESVTGWKMPPWQAALKTYLDKHQNRLLNNK